MSGPVTIDASVFVSAFTPSEPAHSVCHAFLRRLTRQGRPIVLPALAIVEIAAAIGCGQDKPELGVAFASEITQLPQTTLIGLDLPLAEEAAKIAAHHRLRGSDAVYAAVARRYGAILVTLDKEQKSRAAAVVKVRHPGKAG
jgi:predicted nucleic acid-binding protein